jgi:hypothetical protein
MELARGRGLIHCGTQDSMVVAGQYRISSAIKRNDDEAVLVALGVGRWLVALWVYRVGCFEASPSNCFAPSLLRCRSFARIKSWLDARRGEDPETRNSMLDHPIDLIPGILKEYRRIQYVPAEGRRGEEESGRKAPPCGWNSVCSYAKLRGLVISQPVHYSS